MARHPLRRAVSWSPPFQALRQATVRHGSDVRTAEIAARLDLKHLDALTEWEAALSEPSLPYEFVMREGDLVLFDNRRVLHARRGFRDLTEEERRERRVDIVPGEPTRWMKGCYLDAEVVWDKLVTLKRQVGARQE